MSTAKQVMDFRASKGITKAQSDEEQRVRSEKARDHALRTGNYDLTREHLNFEVTRGGVVRPIDTSKSIPQLMKENLAARGIKDPNEGLEEPRSCDFSPSSGKKPARRSKHFDLISVSLDL